MAVYESALQVIPVLMVALFLDGGAATRAAAERSRRDQIQKRAYVALCVSAFAVSLCVVSGILDPGRSTQALVIGALMGCTALLAEQAWRGSERASVERRP